MAKPLTPETAEALYKLAGEIVERKRRRRSRQLTIYDAIERWEKEHKEKDKR